MEKTLGEESACARVAARDRTRRERREKTSRPKITRAGDAVVMMSSSSSRVPLAKIASLATLFHHVELDLKPVHLSHVSTFVSLRFSSRPRPPADIPISLPPLPLPPTAPASWPARPADDEAVQGGS